MLFSDPRKLTNDTLREIGFDIFEHSSPPLYHIRDCKRIPWDEASFDDIQLYAICYNDEGDCEVYCDKFEGVWRTVGSVRMLIETLKGDG
jgi:hypothetical protein